MAAGGSNGPLNRWVCSIRKIATPLQELLTGTAITDDSRLRELLYLENPPKGGKSPKRDFRAKTQNKPAPKRPAR
jgi:hypothetical protein